VADKVIDNPILNRPYDEPSRHFAFDEEGITDRIEDARRPSSYFVPVPRPRKGTRQLELAELTADQIRLNELVNRIREQVTRWRHAGYPRVTPTTRRLLEHWADPERENRVLFCQREAGTATSPAVAPIPTPGSNAPCVPRSTNRHGTRSMAPAHGRSRPRSPARSPSR